MRLIDADALKDYLETCECCDKCPKSKPHCSYDCTLPDFLTDDWKRIIDEQPDAQPQRMRGYWKKVDGIYECSECKAKYFGPNNYCPNCGADMRETE